MPHSKRISYYYQHGPYRKHEFHVHTAGVTPSAMGSLHKITLDLDDFFVWWFLNEGAVPLRIGITNFKLNGQPVEPPVDGILEGEVSEQGERLALVGRVRSQAAARTYKYDVVVTNLTNGQQTIWDPELEIRRGGGLFRPPRRKSSSLWAFGVIALGGLLAIAGSKAASRS